jgi:hypothetical protein
MMAYNESYIDLGCGASSKLQKHSARRTFEALRERSLCSQLNHSLQRAFHSFGSQSNSNLLRGVIMRNVAIAATLLSFTLVGSASAQQVIATDPFTGAVRGANAAAAQGAAAAGPLGALVAAPLGLAAGAVTGTLGAVGTVAGAVTGVPTYGAASTGYGYCPAGYTPVTPPNTPSPAVTGVGYCQAVAAPVAYSQPATRRVASVASRRAVSRLAYGAPRRTLAQRVASRTAASSRRVGFRTGPAHGRMAAMNHTRVY